MANLKNGTKHTYDSSEDGHIHGHTFEVVERLSSVKAPDFNDLGPGYRCKDAQTGEERTFLDAAFGEKLHPAK